VIPGISGSLNWYSVQRAKCEGQLTLDPSLAFPCYVRSLTLPVKPPSQRNQKKLTSPCSPPTPTSCPGSLFTAFTFFTAGTSSSSSLPPAATPTVTSGVFLALFLEAGVALGVPAPFLVGVFGVGVPLPLALADCRLVERAPYLEGDGGLALGIMVGE
jgi:hypothetical protein